MPIGKALTKLPRFKLPPQPSVEAIARLFELKLTMDPPFVGRGNPGNPNPDYEPALSLSLSQ
ncbi:hypothetical protein [Phormidium sp. CCY1219]|uniref:hypothetical protein n=1 Tax=Phormidium sp. CCY1219 TaxID=2886104 RepID=UPI002D1E859C|nr:hypothetical protein [Phormidium sp. CCY1219]MEB3828642.1 hypothetical protein [Phormidium sp. CCY1219]